jgi:aminopeptidase N
MMLRAYKAVDQDDLFQALTDQAHMDGTLALDTTVKEIMDPWTKQRGYPLVRVISSDNDTVYILYVRR